MSSEDSRAFPKDDVSLPPALDYEVRRGAMRGAGGGVLGVLFLLFAFSDFDHGPRIPLETEHRAYS